MLHSTSTLKIVPISSLLTDATMSQDVAPPHLPRDASDQDRVRAPFLDQIYLVHGIDLFRGGSGHMMRLGILPRMHVTTNFRYISTLPLEGMRDLWSLPFHDDAQLQALWDQQQQQAIDRRVTASRETMQRLGRRVQRWPLEEDNCCTTCAICLEEFAPRDQISELRCHHILHYHCASLYFTRADHRCPLCRESIENDTPSPRLRTASPLLSARHSSFSLRSFRHRMRSSELGGSRYRASRSRTS